jgi:hypothetical protein
LIYYYDGRGHLIRAAHETSLLQTLANCIRRDKDADRDGIKAKTK